VETWQVESLRLTAFPVAPVFEQSHGWWRAVTNGEPETSSEKRQKQQREDSGPFGGAELALAVDLLRAQWSAGPIMNPEEPPEGIPNIGPFVERRTWFRDLMGDWLGRCNLEIKRLALGGILIQPVDDRRMAYERLNQYLRRVDLNLDCTEFLLRFNRPLPTRSHVAGLSINRLATWSALKVSIARFAVALEDPGNARAAMGEPKYACRLEFDINTDGEYPGTLPQAEFRNLWSEFADLALEVATRGDEAL
jgi:hypothetical protein